MRRIVLFSFVLALVIGLGALTSFPLNEEYYIAYAETDDISGYRQDLAYLNTYFADDISNRIIVKTNRKIQDRDATYSASGFAGLNVLQYDSADEAKRAIEYYSSLSYVDYVVQDEEIHMEDMVSYTSEDTIEVTTMEHLSWGSELLGVDRYQDLILEKYTSDLPIVYVAVLDTGIDTDNEFLTDRIVYDLGISYYDSELYLNSSSVYPFEDDNSHGTHVSGTIVDLTLDNVKIIPIKVLNARGSGAVSNIVSGIEYVLRLKNLGTNICAFNMSLGGSGDSIEEETAINACYEANIMPVVAAGNDNYYAEDFTPASCEKALTISALSQNDYYENFPYIADYSNYGSVIDLCLPGTKVLSCVPDESTYDVIYTSTTGGKYAVISGTSMATPHATALVALYATYYGDLYSVSEVESEIKENTYDFGDLGKDDLYGYGVPSMALAIDEYALTETPTLNYGTLGAECHFDSPISVEIVNNNAVIPGHNYKIYYTLDGSNPTLTNFTEYTAPITIDESTLLRFMIYLFDESGKICGDSTLYEVTYYTGDTATNTDGTGFEISDAGILTAYNSGIRDIVIPEYIDGIKVQGLADNLFFGLNIESFVCDYDITVGFYPFVCCGSLTSISLASTEAEYIAEYCFGLKELILPNVSEIREGYLPFGSIFGNYGSWTFVGCYNLESLYAPKVIEIKENTFSGFKKLNNIEINWQNLHSIGGYAFEYCTALDMNITLDKLVRLGMRAFYGSGITGFKADILEEVNQYTFHNCENLREIYLPNVSAIYNYAISGADSLETVFLGDTDLRLSDSSLYSSYQISFTIYCYDSEYVSNFTDQQCIDINPTLIETDSDNVSLTFSGYDLTLRTYRSIDDSLSDDDVLVDMKSYHGLNIDSGYSFDYLDYGEHYYIVVATDRYENEDLLVVNKSGDEAVFDIEVDSNAPFTGLELSSYSHYAGEVVELILNGVTGYEIDSILLDGEEILGSFVDSRYSFDMPEHNVVIDLEYSPIYYDIQFSVTGNGEYSILDEYGEPVTSAIYDQTLTLQYSSTDSYVSNIYYTVEFGGVTYLDVGADNVSFQMPNSDIVIYIVFKQPNLSNFIVNYDYYNMTFSISAYTGNEKVVQIPQYVTTGGVRFRLNQIGSYCFRNNVDIERIEVQFIDDERDIIVGDNAFDACVNLQYLDIGRVIYVGDQAFSDCSNLLSVDLSKCTYIGKWAFENCERLTTVDLSNCLEMEYYAFQNCSDLWSVTLSDSLKSIPQNAFQDCASLASIDLSHVQKIHRYAFYNCTNLVSIDLSSCDELVENDFGDSYAFYGCSSLVEVLHPTKLRVIPKFAFGNCYSLERFDFSYCEEIGSGAFDNTSFEYVDLSNVKVIEGYPFGSTSRYIFGSNTNLLLADRLSISFYIKFIYIDASYSGSVGSYIMGEFPYIYELGDYTVRAKYSAYYATFKLGDEIVGRELYNFGDSISIPADLQNMLGTIHISSWRDEASGEIVDAAADVLMASSDRTFVAHEYAVTDYIDYVINFYYGYDYDHSGVINDSGDIFLSATYHYGDAISPLAFLPKGESSAHYEYVFRGWQYSDETFGNDALPSVVGNMDFFAVYDYQPNQYLISWYNDQQLIYEEYLPYNTIPVYDEATYGVPTRLIGDDRYTYYSFVGWTPSIVAVTGECRYTAQFELVYTEYVVNYYYGYDYDGSGYIGDSGDIYTTQTYHYDDVVEMPECTHEYDNRGILCSFDRWSADIEGQTIEELYASFDSARTLAIYATYTETPIQYTISWYDGEGELIYSEYYSYGELPVYDQAEYGLPKKDQTNYYSYEFESWDQTPVAVTEDAEYHAQFRQIVRLYSISWLDGDGSVIYTEGLPYDAELVYNSAYYGLPTKASTEYFKYSFKEWAELSDNRRVNGDRAIESEFYAFNIIKNVNDDYQIVDISTLSSIDEVLLDMRDITSDSKLEIRFENLSITFDGRDMYDIKASGAQIFSLTKDFNYTAKKYNGYSRVWSCKIEVVIDGYQIKDFDSGVSIRLNGTLDDKSELYLGGNTINFTREDSDTISFSSNKLGVFLYGEKLDYRIAIIAGISGVLVLAIGAILTVYFVRKKRTRRN